MQDQQQQQSQQNVWTPIQDARNAAGLLVLAAQVFAAPTEVFLRKQFGVKYFGLPSFLAFFALPMWAVFWPEENPIALVVFWGLFILMQLRARIESGLMMVRGDIVHTRYNGRSRLAALLKRTPEQKIKRNIEPWVVVVAGMFMLAVSLPLGSYLITAGFCLGLEASIAESVDRARVMQMHDAWIEQQALADRFRQMQDKHKP